MCEYVGKDFGASYPDSTCIDGYLWNTDSYLWDMDCGHPGEKNEWLYTIGGDVPCPYCNPSDLITGHYEENQMIIDADYVECRHCGNLIFDEYTWIVPKCNNCNQNRED